MSALLARLLTLLRSRAQSTLIALVGLALLGSLLAGCGGGSSTTSSTQHQASSTHAASGGSSKLETTRVAVGIIPISGVLQFFTAQDRGYFKDAGLTVTGTVMAGGAAMIPAMQSGHLDVGFSNPVSLVLANSKGLDFKLIAGGAFLGRGHAAQPLLVAAHSPITSIAQLKGKTVAVNTLENIAGLDMDLLLKRAHVDPASVKLVEIDFPDMLSALKQGRVAAITSAEPFYTMGKNARSVSVLSAEPYTVFSPKPLLGSWIASSKWLSENPNTAAAFVGALKKATRYLDAHPGQEASILAKYTKTSPALAKEMIMPAFRTTVTAKDLGAYTTSMKADKMITQAVSPSDLLWRTAN